MTGAATEGVRLIRPENMWRSVTIQCKPGFEDIVTLGIFESGFSGFEERTASPDILYKAYCLKNDGSPDALERFSAFLKNASGKDGEPPAEIVSVEEVPDEDWEASWREGLGVVEIGKRLAIRPSWVDYDNKDERVEIIIDPKMAFGTGSQETTRLCLEIIEKSSLKDVSILDAGCGSGVIAIASVKLGARCAIGFDIDPFSITNAEENTRSNRVHDYVTVYQADIRHVEPGHFNLVVANIISGILTPIIDRFHSFLMPGGRIIFSGILKEEEKEFVALLKKNRFRVCQVKRIAEWVAIEVEEA